MLELCGKLDLTEFLTTFASYFSRPKPYYIEGDRNRHYLFIKELDQYNFNPPLKTADVDDELLRLSKQGVLTQNSIFEITKIIRYFSYLKNFKFEKLVKEWLEKIVIPPEIQKISQLFTTEGEFKEEADDRLSIIIAQIAASKKNMQKELLRLLGSSKLEPYLVDRQVHLINGEEALMLRAGFNHVLKGSIIGRSSGGFFYIIPSAIESLKQRQNELVTEKEQIVYELCSKISSELAKFLPFLKFINRQFDLFDHYQARLFFARGKNLSFVLAKNDKKVILQDFFHPALNATDAKPFSISLDKKVMMITGVNAGGKTMLLKSILSAVFLAKYLIPMRINSEKSYIGSFDSVEVIADDPQSVKHDISTFAGRVRQFALMFSKHDFLLGVDEIELGTDSDEAASLFKVVIEKLMSLGAKVVVTTHHKRLAALLSANDDVELVAALYDEKSELPKYEFLQGSIGKSYAFETALRYGIPKMVVLEAKQVYGEDKERLNELIERSSSLELELRQKTKELESKISDNEKTAYLLSSEREAAIAEIQKLKYSLERSFKEAIDEAKAAAKELDAPMVHRRINEANKLQKSAAKDGILPRAFEIKVGSTVLYAGIHAVVREIKGDEALLDADGKKVRAKLSSLKEPKPHALHFKLKNNAKKAKTDLTLEKPESARLKLDLHGQRVEEALGALDKFISDALLAGFEELFVYHGIGSGKLAHAVREYLKAHPSVVRFEDAPPNMGGYGATIVYL